MVVGGAVGVLGRAFVGESAEVTVVMRDAVEVAGPVTNRDRDDPVVVTSCDALEATGASSSGTDVVSGAVTGVTTDFTVDTTFWVSDDGVSETTEVTGAVSDLTVDTTFCVSDEGVSATTELTGAVSDLTVDTTFCVSDEEVSGTTEVTGAVTELTVEAASGSNDFVGSARLGSEAAGTCTLETGLVGGPPVTEDTASLIGAVTELVS